VFLGGKNCQKLLKNQAISAVSSTPLPHFGFDSDKALFCMRKIFLKRILCLFKKVSQDDQCVEKTAREKLGAKGARTEKCQSLAPCADTFLDKLSGLGIENREIDRAIGCIS